MLPCRKPASIIRPLNRVPYNLLLRVNQQLVLEKVQLLEEIGQLKAAVHIYRDMIANTKRSKTASTNTAEPGPDPIAQPEADSR